MIYKALIFDYNGTITQRGILPENTHKILQELAKTYTLYVNTSLADSAIESQLKKHNIAHYFSLILGSTSGSKEENISFILQYGKLCPQEVVMVGDSFADRSAAHMVGTDFVWVNYVAPHGNSIGSVSNLSSLKKIL